MSLQETFKIPGKHRNPIWSFHGNLAHDHGGVEPLEKSQLPETQKRSHKNLRSSVHIKDNPLKIYKNVTDIIQSSKIIKRILEIPTDAKNLNEKFKNSEKMKFVDKSNQSKIYPQK